MTTGAEKQSSGDVVREILSQPRASKALMLRALTVFTPEEEGFFDLGCNYCGASFQCAEEDTSEGASKALQHLYSECSSRVGYKESDLEAALLALGLYRQKKGSKVAEAKEILSSFRHAAEREDFQSFSRHAAKVREIAAEQCAHNLRLSQRCPLCESAGDALEPWQRVILASSAVGQAVPLLPWKRAAWLASEEETEEEFAARATFLGTREELSFEEISRNAASLQRFGYGAFGLYLGEETFFSDGTVSRRLDTPSPIAVFFSAESYQTWQDARFRYGLLREPEAVKESARAELLQGMTPTTLQALQEAYFGKREDIVSEISRELQRRADVGSQIEKEEL